MGPMMQRRKDVGFVLGALAVGLAGFAAACGSGADVDPSPASTVSDDGAVSPNGEDGGGTSDARGDGGGDAGSKPGALSGRAAPPCTVDGWCWAWPPGAGSDFDFIAGTADDDVWLSGPFPVLHYDGTALRSFEEIPASFKSGPIAVVSAKDVWLFAGYSGYNDAYRYDGAKFSRVQGMPFTNATRARTFGNTIVVAAYDVYTKQGAGPWVEAQTGLFGAVVGIAGSGPNDLWAATKNAVAHFDGMKWTETPVSGMEITDIDATTDGAWLAGFVPDVPLIHAVARPTSMTTWEITNSPSWHGSMTSIRAVSKNDVLAVGTLQGSAHWNGQKWSFDEADDVAQLRASWSSPSGRVWAAGEEGRLQYRNASGSGWTRVSGRDGGHSHVVTDFWGSSANDLWAVGGNYPRDGKTTNALLLHWNGTTFTEVASPPPIARYLERVSGSGPSNVWTISDTDILRYDGTSWTTVPAPDAATHLLRGIDVAGVDDVWLLEQAKVSSPYLCRATHFDGTSWTPTADITCDSRNSSAIRAFGPNELWMGRDGTVANAVRWDGTKWNGSGKIEDRVANFFRLDATNAWLAGGRSLYRKTSTAVAWEEVTTLDVSSRADSVFAFSANDLWIASNTDVRRWNGSAWTTQRSGLSYSQASNLWPSRVWGAAPNDVWMFTANGLLRRK